MRPLPALGSREVRLRRPPKPVAPDRHIGVEVEDERTADGLVRLSVTVFLAGAECPYTCVFCDLWKHTLEGATPPGALPRQLRIALEDAGVPGDGATLKLYNASNFFDRRAVPPEDLGAIADLCAPFGRVVVECHPRIVDESCFRFAASVGGRLEVAMGLETVHPEALRRMNKGVTVDDFDAAARRLIEGGVAVRAFVLVAAPFVPAGESVDWTVHSAEHAVAVGASHVSLIPVRDGNGTMELLRDAGVWVPPTLGELEDALDRTVGLPAVVTADLWDADRLADCGCGAERVERLRRMNLSGRIEPAVRCDRCGGSTPSSDGPAAGAPVREGRP